MEHYLGVAREAGLSNEEIGTVESIVMAIAAGKVKAQMGEVINQRERKLSDNG